MKYLLALVSISILACTPQPPESSSEAPVVAQIKQVFQQGGVYADNTFAGARLSDFIQLNDSSYRAYIEPENTPVNNSPWYGFRIWAAQEKEVQLEIGYAEGYPHRFVPKISKDGKSWEAIDSASYREDTTKGTALLRLSLTPEKLWISAQENFNTSYVNAWIDSLNQLTFIEKETIGETVLGNPIQVLQIQEGEGNNVLVLIARQHPPEVPGGTIALQAFVKGLLANSDLAVKFRDQFRVLLFPLLNPDGVDRGNWRHNANGKDLNRDWQAFSQPETKTTRDWLLAYQQENQSLQFSYGIDFHTSYSGPYLLTLDTIPQAKVKPRFTNTWIERIQGLTGDSLDIRPRAQTLPYCYNWMINELGMEAVTYEEGDEIDRNLIKKRGKDYANTLMETLLVGLQ